jgi:hypothetical protein
MSKATVMRDSGQHLSITVANGVSTPWETSLALGSGCWHRLDHEGGVARPHDPESHQAGENASRLLG